MPQIRMNFYSIFKLNPDGSIEPIRPVRIGGVQMSPGVRFGGGVLFGGVNLSQYVGRDFAVEDSEGIITIVGIY